MSLRGHYYTLWPAARHAMFPLQGPLCAPWSCAVEDPQLGRVRIDGLLHVVPNSASIVLILHGLGGRADGVYGTRAAAAATRLHISSLRVWTRGSDRRGEDFGHAGLTSDIHAILAHPTLRRYRRIYLLGYSIGGHLALKLATEVEDPRVLGVAAICPPLDLALAASAFDERIASPYRQHILNGLKDIYEAVASRRPVPSPVAEVRKVRTIQDWDRLTVVPRHGFASVAEYYESQSVATKFRELRVPAVVVVSEDDPIVPPEAVRHALSVSHGKLNVRWVRGGHVGFPSNLSLGVRGPRGLEPQVLTWLHSLHRAEEDACERMDEPQVESRDSSPVLLLD